MVHEAWLNFFITLCMFRDSARQKEGPAFGFVPRGGRGRLARVMVGAVFCSGPGARWVTHPKVAGIRRPGADAAGGLGTMRGSGAPILGPGERGSGGRPLPPRRRTKGAAGPAPGPGKVCERPGPRPARAAPHNGPAERGKAERHAPAPQGCGPVPGACPSRRPRPPLARPGRSSCSRTGSGRAGSAASTSSAPATRTPGSGTASPPTVSSGGRGRQLGSPPGPGPGGGGGAAASGHRRRRPSSSHRRQVARAAPFGAEAGGGRSGGRAAFSSPPRPFPVRNANASSSGFHPEHVQTQEERSLYPMSGGGPAGEAGGRLPFRTFPVAAAWAHNGGRSGETSEKG